MGTQIPAPPIIFESLCTLAELKMRDRQCDQTHSHVAVLASHSPDIMVGERGQDQKDDLQAHLTPDQLQKAMTDAANIELLEYAR